MVYNPSIHNRRSIRLKNYDYSQEGLYFITICCQDRALLFGHVENGKMQLNKFGEIADSEWKNSEKIRRNIQIHEYIIMPNHIHGIIEILFKEEKKNRSTGESKFAPTSRTGELRFAPTRTGKSKFAPTNESKFAPTKFQSPSHTIGSIIRGYKIATIKRIKDYIKEEDKRNPSTGESKFAPIRTGESKFAPTRTGESKFAPTNASAKKKILSLDFKIWQRNYYEHIIKDPRAYRNISNYIINNPKKWGEDKFSKRKK